jgi:hypothetical protein
MVMTRRGLSSVASVVAIAVGVALIAVLLATSQLSASSSADEAIALTAPHSTRGYTWVARPPSE